MNKSLLTAILCSCLGIILAGGNSEAAPSEGIVGKVLNVCSSPDVRTAVIRANQLGWQRQADADIEQWRAAFIGYNGGTVDVVAWRNEDGNKADTLSFWVAVGPNGHKACAYSASSHEGLLDAMVQLLGPPDTSEKNAATQSRSASWTEGGLVYRYGQVGSAAGINVGPN